MYALKRMHLDIKTQLNYFSRYGSKCSSYSKIKNDPHETLYQRQILDLRQSTLHFRPSLNFETTPNFRPRQSTPNFGPTPNIY